MAGVKSIKEYQGEETNWAMIMNVSSLKAELSKNACFCAIGAKSYYTCQNIFRMLYFILLQGRIFVQYGSIVFVPRGKKYLIYVRAINIYYMYVCAISIWVLTGQIVLHVHL